MLRAFSLNAVSAEDRHQTLDEIVMSETTTVACPKCATKLRLNGDVAGKKVKCPKCATTFRIGSKRAASPDKTASPPSQRKKAATSNKSDPSQRKKRAASGPESKGNAPRKKSSAAPTKKKRKAKSSDVDDLYDDFGVGADESFGDDGFDEYDPYNSPPPKKKKKKSKGKSRSKNSTGGSFQESIHRLGFVGWALCGCSAGLIGIFITTLVGYTDILILIGIMALITGSMVGTAIRFAANPTQGWGPGLTSVAIAFAAIMLGKVGAFYVWSGEMVDDEVTMEDEIAMYTSESGLIAPIADEVHAEWEESGKITEEQMEVFYGEHIEDYEDYEMGADYDHSADYLPEVWAEATKRWQAKSDEEKEQARNQVVKDIRDTWLGDEAEFGTDPVQLTNPVLGVVQFQARGCAAEGVGQKQVAAGVNRTLVQSADFIRCFDIPQLGRVT